MTTIINLWQPSLTNDNHPIEINIINHHDIHDAILPGNSLPAVVSPAGSAGQPGAKLTSGKPQSRNTWDRPGVEGSEW